MIKILAVAVIMFLFQVAVKADAASIRVEQVGKSNVYIVKGYDLNDVGGVEVEIQYDTATLSNPRIAQGSKLASAMFMANPNCTTCSVPNSIKIAAMSLSAINGSGDLATITFDLKGDTPGTVTVVRQKLAAPTGGKITTDDGKLAAEKAAELKAAEQRAAEQRAAEQRAAEQRAAEQRAAEQRAAEQNGNATATTENTANTVSGTPSIGTITLPADQLASSDKKTDYQPLVTDLRKDMTIPLEGSEAGKASAGKQQDGKGKEQEKKFVAYKSALQLFGEFKGEKSSKSLIPLFAEVSIPDFKQEPPIAFSDGKTPFRLSLVLKPTGSEAPKFILQGANVKKLSGEGEDSITWTVDAVPKKDATEAKLTVIDGQSIIEIPLTIVPRIDPLLTKGKTLSEADFALYLKKPQKHDLNKDKKFDAVDDFIFTANYIVAMKIKPEKLKKEEKKEPSKPEKKDDAKAKDPAKVKAEKGKAGDKPPVKLPVKP